MYECLIVIPTYNPGEFIFKNLEIYRQLDPDKYKVLLIDNGTNNQQSLDILNKVNEEFTVEKNMFGGGYEPGALLHAVNKYESKRVFLTQDSMELIEHSPKTSGRVAKSGNGGVTSSKITFCVWTETLPLPSSKVQVTKCVPCVLIGKDAVVIPVMSAPQLSVAVGASMELTEQSPKTSGRVAISGTGAVTSSKITFCVWVETLPLPSSKLHVTRVAP
jgi:hypothetical protein